MTLITFLALLAGLVVWLRLAFREEVDAALARDPAASNGWEILLTYPGLHAVMAYRIAHSLLGWKVPFLPRLISQISRFLTGIEIHPGARIGKGFFIDHGMGVVIGETAVIGNDVTLFQGVTLGGTGKEKGKRHPTLGSNVVVSTGAKVLGNITIGDSVNVGANAVVIRSVPAHCTVVGVPGRIVKKKGRRVPGINLDHTKLPDPVTERLENLQHEIDSIEDHFEQLEKKKEKDGA